MNGTSACPSLQHMLKKAVAKQASDIHLKVGLVPVMRKHGKLKPLSTKYPPLEESHLTAFAHNLMNEEQKSIFEQQKQVDLAYQFSGVGRFRIHLFSQKGSLRIVIRNIPLEVPELANLGLPGTLEEITKFERGLILVTGATGSGKSTTLASMIDHINKTQNKHIVTIEDPIEFYLSDRKSIISQVEVGCDTPSFKAALRATLRQDPDVIFVGEMRDQETIEIALAAAETGHLVISTLHTSDAAETVHRILSAFPPEQHAQLRFQLASVLKSVVSMRLARRSTEDGFVPVTEILLNNPRVAELIMDPRRTSEIRNVIEESQQQWGMQSFDQSLHELLREGVIDLNEALSHASNPENFSLRQSGISNNSQRKQWKADRHKSTRRKNQQSWNTTQDLELELETQPGNEPTKTNLKSKKGA